VDFYQLVVKDGKYSFDGAWKEFARSTKTVKIKLADGSMREEKIEVRKSVHGPVVFDENGVTVAMRVAGLDRPKMLEQWYRMGGATNLKQFQEAMRMTSVPMWNANYADSDGHIMLVCAGVIPRRKVGDFSSWAKVVPGDTSKTLWTDYLTFEELPKSVDPASAFHQNANEGPWLTTQPSLKPEQFPAFFGPDPAKPPTFRTKRSLRMISEDKSITYEELLGYKHNTRVELADAVLPDLLAGKSDDAEVIAALGVLGKWDRHMEVASRGAVLFQMWSDVFFGTGDFIDSKLRVKYDAAKPLESAYGIADVPAALAALKTAAGQMKQVYGALDVPYGDVYRFARGEKDLPGNGGAGRLGLFRTMTYGRRVGTKFYPTHGETFVCAIEFGGPQKAQCLLGYGNATQKGSKHIDDQLPLMVEKKLHPVLRERKEIEAKLEQKEVLN
jgi:acyl-homoserine-lactone acylase